MKHRCTHCEHIFELEEKAFRRCPNCFWTTSLVPVSREETIEGPLQVRPAQTLSDHLPKKKNHRFIFVAVIAVIGALSFWFFIRNVPHSLSTGASSPLVTSPALHPEKSSGTAPTAQYRSNERPTGAGPNGTTQIKLTEEDRSRLFAPFQMTIPRALTEDEKKMLEKRISPPELSESKPTVSVWSKEDFDSLLEAEQKRRKITLGWMYLRSLKKIFEKHYLPAAEAVRAGNVELARDELVKSLSFPVYQNDLKLFRAVVLVMLRPYINDVIGKIAALNQRGLKENSAKELQHIFHSYDGLFATLAQGKYLDALQEIRALKNQIRTFESRPADTLVRYPASLRTLDPELQNAIRQEAEPKADAVFNSKPILLDLGIKEKVTEQNAPETLKKSQDTFGEAVGLLKESRWEEARTKLRAIEAPPELVEEARERLAMLDRLLSEKGSDATP